MEYRDTQETTPRPGEDAPDTLVSSDKGRRKGFLSSRSCFISPRARQTPRRRHVHQDGAGPETGHPAYVHGMFVPCLSARSRTPPDLGLEDAGGYPEGIGCKTRYVPALGLPACGELQACLSGRHWPISGSSCRARRFERSSHRRSLGTQISITGLEAKISAAPISITVADRNRGRLGPSTLCQLLRGRLKMPAWARRWSEGAEMQGVELPDMLATGTCELRNSANSSPEEQQRL